MDNQLEESLSDIIDVLKKREKQYEGAIVSGSLLLGKQGPGIGKLEILFADKEYLRNNKVDIRDYGNCRLIRYKTNVKEARDFVTNLYKGKGCTFGEEDIDYKPTNPQLVRLNSSETPTKFGWPCYLFKASASQSGSRHVDGPLLSTTQPLFPHLRSGEKDWLVFGDPELYQRGIECLGVVLPDFRARFGELQIGPGELRIDVENRLANDDEILGKWYVGFGSKDIYEDFSVDDTTISLPIDSLPQQIQVYLIDNKTSEGLDWRDYWWRAEKLDPGTTFEVHEGDIEVFLRQGESQFVEFKREFNPKYSKEFHETVSAFANTKGGVILMGVDDNGTVVGVGESSLEDRIRDSINNSIQPLPEISFEGTKHEGLEVLLIKVDVGDNPPYMVGGLAFVRSGGTDRIARRPDLDAIYSSRDRGSQPNSVWSR